MKWKARSKVEQRHFCRLANCTYSDCYNRNTKLVVGCSIWDEIEPFKKLLLEIKYKRIQHEVESKV
jgi:hypothetical protein